MKKLFVAAFLLFSSVAAISTVSNDRTKQFSDQAYVAIPHNDTVPSDTTKPDSTSFGLLSYNVIDTVPTDTTKDTTSALLAYNILRDTVPTDTTKKDTTSFGALAYNILRDTVPTDTSKKDTSFQYFAMVR